MSKFSILIVEDEPLIAHDLEAALNNLDYSVCGIAYNPTMALDKLAQRQADLVILDVHLGTGLADGISIGQVIQDKFHLPFIYLTSFTDRSTLDRAKETYPMAYLVKPFEEDELFRTLEIALHTFSRLNPRTSNDLLRFNAKLAEPLSAKEMEVLADLLACLTNRQIAEKHFLSVNTIGTHVKNIFAKCGVGGRMELLMAVKGS
ncbi:response regulator transcription factor [Haliscomenobacter hydrossis]|uniref:Two component transcriptional regulator, LuxR family n=1 Tax=Haliscomenobacter hydrossis (strain ATCC 27775 / DSM 1100 / LMG 10767 / O) TaxID=760192 RepID=F4KYY9_HALH1|nr:response regulator transcription factor [Haliscomenobacter hydrossis]AEE52676.1 two component transcriptional regulator, LuxR family [Haliscomenobacter hydrossis DSM 1100]